MCEWWGTTQAILTNHFSVWQAQLDDLEESLGNVGPTNLGFVCREKKKPKVLRLYEPDIEDE